MLEVVVPQQRAEAALRLHTAHIAREDLRARALRVGLVLAVLLVEFRRAAHLVHVVEEGDIVGAVITVGIQVSR